MDSPSDSTRVTSFCSATTDMLMDVQALSYAKEKKEISVWSSGHLTNARVNVMTNGDHNKFLFKSDS